MSEVAVEPIEVIPPIAAPPGGSLLVTPKGFRIALRNPNTLRVRDRRAIMGNVSGGQGQAGALYIDMLNRVAAALIKEWDLRGIDDAGVPYGPVLPLPSVSVDVLEDVPLAELRDLDQIVQDALKIAMPDFRQSVDEASPTHPSAG